MPLVTQPNLIEESDFSGGWGPDGADEATSTTTSPDLSNLILDRQSGAMLVRDGYEDTGADFDGSIGPLTVNHCAKQVFHVNLATTNYVVVVFSTNTSGNNNIVIAAVDSETYAVTRIDTAGVDWNHPEEHMWMVKIDNVLYGGLRGNHMWSWDGTTYDSDAATPNTKTWHDDTGASVTTATQYGRDYAFTGKELAKIGSDIYKPLKDIRYSLWKVTEHYSVGDRVSRKQDGYFRSYRCIKGHQADAVITRPDDGSSYSTYWKRVRLDDPQDDDGDTTNDWAYVPAAARTNVATWFADRLWLRFDGSGDGAKGRVQYSAPLRIDKGQDIADVDWNPKDWAPGDDLQGPGGGWLPVEDGAKTGRITALRAFGQYLLVLKASTVWAISGYDDASWNVRRVSRISGCVSEHAHLEHDGLVYFLGDGGLYVTDGTAVQEAPGNEKVQQWFRRRLDSAMQSADDDGNTPWLFHYKGFVGIAIPDFNSADPYQTVFYDPKTQSFWRTDMPVRSFTSYGKEGVTQYSFVTGAAGDLKLYNATPNVSDDDNGTPVSWYYFTPWLTFGTAHQERRVRRTWWVTKFDDDSVSADLSGYTDYNSDTALYTVTRTGDANGNAKHLEGAWMKDAHAVQLQLAGTEGPGKVFGFAVHTEPRRTRYHRG